MKGRFIDSVFYTAKTMLFFLFVGGLVGTVLMLPFVEMITHRPFRFPESVFMLLLGYIVIGMPVAAFAGLVYGISLAASQLTSMGRSLSAAMCGMAPILFLAVLGYIWNPRTPIDSLFAITEVFLFTGLAGVITGWVHYRVEARFRIFRPTVTDQKAS